jgi:hypothetical protein
MCFGMRVLGHDNLKSLDDGLLARNEVEAATRYAGMLRTIQCYRAKCAGPLIAATNPIIWMSRYFFQSVWMQRVTDSSSSEGCGCYPRPTNCMQQQQRYYGHTKGSSTTIS